MSEQAKKWFNESEYRNYQQFIKDGNENKWNIIELSDLPEILQAYADKNLKDRLKRIEDVFQTASVSEDVELERGDGFRQGVRWVIKQLKDK